MIDTPLTGRDMHLSPDDTLMLATMAAMYEEVGSAGGELGCVSVATMFTVGIVDTRNAHIVGVCGKGAGKLGRGYLHPVYVGEKLELTDADAEWMTHCLNFIFDNEAPTE